VNDLYDQDGNYYDQQYDLWRDQIAAREESNIAQALEREQLLMWEHELSQPNYHDYFLEEMLRP
jgi:hypothetical protein